MADKKITELPFITDITASIGSSPSNTTVIPVVLYGTTNQITADNLKDNFIRNVRGTVKDIQTYTSSLKGAITVEGNGIEVAGNLEVQGNMSVKGTIFTQYETSSIIYTSGSTKFGNSFDDLHEFTGSVVSTGSYTINGEDYTFYSSSNSEVFTNFSSSNSTAITSFSSSNSTLFTNFSSSNSSYNTTFSSSNATYVTALSSSNSTTFTNYSSSTADTINGLSSGVSNELARVYQSTASIQAQTASLLAFTASQVDRNTNLSIVTGSLNNFTASQDNRNFVISQYTSSTDAHIVGISDFTSSQLAVNLGNSIYTASVDSHIVGISTYTSSVRDTLARVHQSTASLQQFTASQDDRNLTLSTVTGSLIGITNGLMAFTASLDNTFATDAQLYQLYQATSSLELHSGSMIGVTNGLMAYTASNTTLNTGLRGEVDGIEAYTASLKGQAIVSSSTQVQNYDVFALNSNLYTSTGSLIGITNGLMAFTAALDNTYATDAQLYQLYQATGSIELTTGSLIGITNGLMAFTAALDSTYATDAQLYQLYAETASIKAEIAGIEAYTASLKSAAIVSSSTQIQNYNLFAQTSSANTFYGTQTISGSLNISAGNINILRNTGASYITAETTATNGEAAFALYGKNSSGTVRTAQFKYDNGDVVRLAVTSPIGLRFETDDIIRLTIANDGGINANGAITASYFKVPSGGGLDFSATSNGSGTMTSELLNDYEEGTWTPTVVFVGTPGTVNYVERNGRYTKIGRIVHAEYSITGCSITGSSGYIKITGIPFTINSVNGPYQALAVYGGLNFPSSSVLYQQGGIGDTVIYPQILNNSGFYADFTEANINTGKTFNLSVSYTYTT